MYIPAQFEQTDPGLWHTLIRDYPLATLVSQGEQGMDANHIPLYLAQAEGATLTLQGHIARANPLCAALASGQEILAIFQGPHGYITPSWYSSKQVDARVVPTWNYAVVHVYGQARLIEEHDWLVAHLDRMVQHNEAGFAQPWALADAPADFVDKLTRAIVGVEIRSTRVQAKWKMSQNQSAQNRDGVIRGLQPLQPVLAQWIELYGVPVKE